MQGLGASSHGLDGPTRPLGGSTQGLGGVAYRSGNAFFDAEQSAGEWMG